MPNSQSAIVQYELIWNFAQRELKSRFKGTVLGWVWSLALPAANLLILTVVFGLVLKAKAPDFGNGRESIFAIWMFSGIFVFQFFSNGVLRSVEGLYGAAPLLARIPVSGLAPVMGAILAVATQTLIEGGILLFVLAVLLNTSWTWILLPAVAILLVIFTAAIGVIFAVFAAYFRDVAQMTAILMQFLFYATPVMYPASMIPNDAPVHLRSILTSAPMARFIELFRNLVYDLKPGTWSDWAILVLWTIGAVIVAVLVWQRHGRDVAEVLV